MSDLIHQLRQGAYHCYDYRWRAADEITTLRADIISYKIGYKDLQDHCAEMERLINKLYAENKRLDEYLTAENEKLRAALRDVLSSGLLHGPTTLSDEVLGTVHAALEEK